MVSIQDTLDTVLFTVLISAFKRYWTIITFPPGLEKDSDPEKMEKIAKMLEEQENALDPPRSVSPLRRILKSVRQDAHDILF